MARKRDGRTQTEFEKEWRKKRREAKQTIVSALRIVCNIQDDYDIPTSEVLRALAKIYLKMKFWDSYRWLIWAAKKISSEETIGGR